MEPGCCSASCPTDASCGVRSKVGGGSVCLRRGAPTRVAAHDSIDVGMGLCRGMKWPPDPKSMLGRLVEKRPTKTLARRRPRTGHVLEPPWASYSSKDSMHFHSDILEPGAIPATCRKSLLTMLRHAGACLLSESLQTHPNSQLDFRFHASGWRRRTLSSARLSIRPSILNSDR